MNAKLTAAATSNYDPMLYTTVCVTSPATQEIFLHCTLPLPATARRSEKALFLRPPPPSRFLSSSVPRASRHSHTAYHAHSPLRPPTRRLQARFAAETRRILAIQSASRWTRHLASLHLHFICRYAAQLLLNAVPLEPWHDSAPASGAKRNQRRC